MSHPGDHARLAATARAREVLAAGGHVITSRLKNIWGPRAYPGLDETWTGHCERCGESFAMTFRNGAWETGGMVYVWAANCRGEWRSYYAEEEADDYRYDEED